MLNISRIEAGIVQIERENVDFKALIERAVDGQRRPARLKAEPMAAAVGWLEAFERFWTDSFGQLDGLLTELKASETGEE